MKTITVNLFWREQFISSYIYLISEEISTIRYTLNLLLNIQNKGYSAEIVERVYHPLVDCESNAVEIVDQTIDLISRIEKSIVAQFN